MNDEKQPHRAEDSFGRILSVIKQYATQEPGKAVITAFGVGLLIDLLPTRLIVATATTISVTLLRPALLTLGVLKATEICFPQTATKSIL